MGMVQLRYKVKFKCHHINKVVIQARVVCLMYIPEVQF